jgi:hypothetical protein
LRACSPSKMVVPGTGCRGLGVGMASPSRFFILLFYMAVGRRELLWINSRQAGPDR